MKTIRYGMSTGKAFWGLKCKAAIVMANPGWRAALSIVRVVRSSASLAEPVTNGNGYGDDNSHDEIGPEIHLHQETRSHRHNEKTQNGPFGPLMIFTSARNDEARFGQGLSETSLPL